MDPNLGNIVVILLNNAMDSGSVDISCKSDTLLSDNIVAISITKAEYYNYYTIISTTKVRTPYDLTSESLLKQSRHLVFPC